MGIIYGQCLISCVTGNLNPDVRLRAFIKLSSRPFKNEESQLHY